MSTNLSFQQLETYIREQMRMSHVYQPVVLQVLLEKGGTASTEDVAKAPLSYDRSQVEYYEIRTKNMVGKLTLDARRKTFIHDHLDCAYALVETSAAAYELERAARRGDVFGVQPYLNPL